jgi:hypothetical protein
VITRWSAVWLGAVCAAAITPACSGSGHQSAGGESAGRRPVATLTVLEKKVTVGRGAEEPADPVDTSAELSQGDQVQTDITGFAEIAFFDGSWQRIEGDTALTLTELVDIESGQVVRTGIDKGRAWQRVGALTQADDAFEVDTPVAVASVRGTAYSIDCSTEPVECTFAVVEGEVGLTTSDGSTTALRAGDRLTVSRDAPTGTPERVGIESLREDDWIARNLARDDAEPPAPPARDNEDASAAPIAPAELARVANDICAEAGAQNEDLETADNRGDQLAREQAAVLAGALDQLSELDVPAEVAEPFRGMIEAYRRRTELVDEAIGAGAAERERAVRDLVGATADGAELARQLGLASCIIRTR